MEFKVGDYVECKPKYFRVYGITTNYYIGRVIEVSSTEFKTRTVRYLSGSYNISNYAIICGLEPKYFRKVSDFKLALIRNRGKLI